MEADFVIRPTDAAGGRKEKTGVELKGCKAINPANNEEIPIWVADYVLGSYGTGAIMAVPAHDERDFDLRRSLGWTIKKWLPSSGEFRTPSTSRKENTKRNIIYALVKHPTEDQVYGVTVKEIYIGSHR